MDSMELRADRSDKLEESPPECFGQREQVCPTDEEGFIQPRQKCVGCQLVRPCLRTALEMTDSAEPKPAATTADSGVMRFLRRWSEQKVASR